MKQEDIENIQTLKTQYDGDLDLAIAAHVMTPGVIAKCGGIIPSFADNKKLARVKRQFAEATAKKPTQAKAKTTPKKKAAKPV